jgi:hypothetical protein
MLLRVGLSQCVDMPLYKLHATCTVWKNLERVGLAQCVGMPLYPIEEKLLTEVLEGSE